jgi:hypothetical protein
MVDSTVSAMTWNIWWRFGPRWRDRQPGIKATFEQFSPDIVALQEVWSTSQTTQADGWEPVTLRVRVDHPTGPLSIIATRLDYGVPYTDDRRSTSASTTSSSVLDARTSRYSWRESTWLAMRSTGYTRQITAASSPIFSRAADTVAS